DAAGEVTHLLIVVSDVTRETVTRRRLGGLVASTPVFSRLTAPRELARAALRHAEDLLPNAGSMVAVLPRGRGDAVSVLAASGVWSRADRRVDRELQLALVRNAIAGGASVELEWEGGPDAVQTLRIVPLLPRRALGDGRQALGALALARLQPGSFS